MHSASLSISLKKNLVNNIFVILQYIVLQIFFARIYHLVQYHIILSDSITVNCDFSM